MNITEFAQSRNKTVGAISNYIQRHRDLFKGHTKRTGNTAELDDYALEILEKKYPLPKPAEIVEDLEAIKELSETRKELAEAGKRIEVLQTKLLESSKQIAQAEATKLLLEDKEAQLDKAELRMEKAEKETQDLKTKNENLSAELEKLRIENATLKNRGLFARIFNKI